MEKKKRKRPELRMGSHYMKVNGEYVKIDPYKTDLPDRCKLVWAEAILGQKVELVEG